MQSIKRAGKDGAILSSFADTSITLTEQTARLKYDLSTPFVVNTI